MLTDDYRLIRYPDWALDPTFPAAQVTRSRSGRAVAEVIDEVTARVRRWHLPGVAWWVSATTLPPDTEAVLRAGAQQIDAVRILVRELGGAADLAVPGDVRVELVADARTFRAASMVTVRGWGRPNPPRRRSTVSSATVRDLAAWSSFRVLAAGGRARPVRAAGARCAPRWPTCAARSPCAEYRRRGAYPAVLAIRCGWPASMARRSPW